MHTDADYKNDIYKKFNIKNTQQLFKGTLRTISSEIRKNKKKSEKPKIIKTPKTKSKKSPITPTFSRVQSLQDIPPSAITKGIAANPAHSFICTKYNRKKLRNR